jgi:hypothetical protein
MLRAQQADLDSQPGAKQRDRGPQEAHQIRGPPSVIDST